MRSTMDASTSAAADLPSISTETTNRNRFFFRTRIPSTPMSGPDLTLTQSPDLKNG